MRCLIDSRALALTVLAGAVALGGCHPRRLNAIAKSGGMHISTSEPLDGPIRIAKRLTCPSEAGEWRRKATAEDGSTCSYASDKGLLDLALVSGPAGDPAAALAPERRRLDALMPAARDSAVVVESTTDAQGRKTANVDMPFLQVHDDGTHKSVKILGFSVDKTDGPGDRDDEGDRPRPAKPGAGAKLVYLLAGQTAAPGGYHAVGYEARSDGGGRFVVASFKLLRGGEVHGDDDDNGIGHLLALNAPHTGDSDDHP